MSKTETRLNLLVTYHDTSLSKSSVEIANMETMNLDEVSKVLKITKATARNRISLGLPMPPSFKVGRHRLFPKAEFELWLAQQSETNKK